MRPRARHLQLQPGIWLSSTPPTTRAAHAVNGVLKNDLQQNWRWGATLDDRSTDNSIKLYVSSGVAARTGNNFDVVGIAWQYRWGAGL